MAQEQDNWKHRSKGMLCGTCMYFVPKLMVDESLLSEGCGVRVQIGRCRRHAPTMSGYPAVFTNDFCGDHKIDEEKLTK